MTEKFRNDFNWMLRESKGYFPWLNYDSHRIHRYLFTSHHHKCPHCYERNHREIIKMITEQEVCENSLLDLFYKALIRSEIRFISRYVPQRSNEERLTGNLVSEIDSAIYLIKDEFNSISKQLYSESKEIDFLYYDLSKGGKVEKQSGANLGFLLIIDLPDYPKIIKSIVLQAKKISGSAHIDRIQYETLKKNDDNNCAYLFYDMNYSSLTSPIVLGIDDYYFKQKYEQSIQNNSKSFSIDYKEIRNGLPLSLFFAFQLIEESVGKIHRSVEDALEYFQGLTREKTSVDMQPFNGRVGIASLGKSINYGFRNNEVFEITV